ncbi:hypothetical protein ACVR09_01475 [Streptococcus catagoni]
MKPFVCILFSESGHYTLPFNRFYPHGFEDDKIQDMGGHWINLICDDTIILFGTLDQHCDVIWPHNVAMCLLAKEYVSHDAYTLKIIQEHGEITIRPWSLLKQKMKSLRNTLKMIF